MTGSDPKPPEPPVTWAAAFRTLFSAGGLAGVIVAIGYAWQIATR